MTDKIGQEQVQNDRQNRTGAGVDRQTDRQNSSRSPRDVDQIYLDIIPPVVLLISQISRAREGKRERYQLEQRLATICNVLNEAKFM